jgi:hypothetical protein
MGGKEDVEKGLTRRRRCLTQMDTEAGAVTKICRDGRSCSRNITENEHFVLHVGERR